MSQILKQSLSDDSLQRRALIFTFLEEICQELELTETQFERAKVSYDAVGQWLSQSDDPLLSNLFVYLQGSGAIGTSIKPIGKDEFDIDLIGFAKGVTTATTPAQLKKAIGDRLAENKTYSKILEEKKRCWRLNYSGDFHLDISPTISNPLCEYEGELVPDRKLKMWHPTNPKAYKSLFDRRASLVPRLTHSVIANQRDEANIEPFPIKQSTKGILRRTVQLLKRHRDYYFLSVTEEIAPISVIITTLAMQAYEYCIRRHVFADELDVVVETIRMMPHFIEHPIINGQRIHAIWNETTDGENFAERWIKEPNRINAFYEWHAKALADFEGLQEVFGLDNVISGMNTNFGERVVSRVMHKRTEAVTKARTLDGLFVAPVVGLSTSANATTTPVLKNDFYGD